METSIMITFLNLNSVLLLCSSKTIPLGWYSWQRLKPQKVTFWNIHYIPLDSTQLPNNLYLVKELKIKDNVSSQSCEPHLFVIVISFRDYFTLWSNFSIVKKCDIPPGLVLLKSHREAISLSLLISLDFTSWFRLTFSVLTLFQDTVPFLYLTPHFLILLLALLKGVLYESFYHMIQGKLPGYITVLIHFFSIFSIFKLSTNVWYVLNIILYLHLHKIFVNICIYTVHLVSILSFL